MPDFVAWSYSRLKMFRECPRKAYFSSIAPWAERIPFEENHHMKAGTAVDDALTARLSARQPLPPQYTHLEPWPALVDSLPGHTFTQLEVALDQSFQVVPYFAGRGQPQLAWVRGKFDVAKVNGIYAWIGDWKNGQVAPEMDQLKLFAALGFRLWPEVQVIDTDYIWLKHDLPTSDHFERRQEPDLWAEFMQDVERMQVANRTNQWPATPSKDKWGWNCKRCDVNKHGKCKDAAVAYEAYK